MNFVHPDHLGAPQKMTDVDRNIVWDASFLPFGEEDSLIGSAANNNRSKPRRVLPVLPSARAIFLPPRRGPLSGGRSGR
ncbi:RHS domain-containing protein [Sneathiella sp. HT1-7]|uniref:RHS domain-containing protein n=1 Tax=Sneathiella sp. HT1-7 TaxID=2887192 RepID=UPI001D1475A8|nr:RHS domain-containing protein [Sneathiella sp. HT1-7]